MLPYIKDIKSFNSRIFTIKQFKICKKNNFFFPLDYSIQGFLHPNKTRIIDED